MPPVIQNKNLTHGNTEDITSHTLPIAILLRMYTLFHNSYWQYS